MDLFRSGSGKIGVLGVILAIIALISLENSAAGAQTFPSKEIEMIINFSPGGSTDMMARIVGDRVSKLLKVPVVFINKPGGGGAIAANSVAHARPDGHTVGTGGASNLGTLLATSDKIPYTLKDFSGVARAAIVPLIVIVKKGRYDTFENLIKEAQKKPGVLTFGSWGSMSTSHIMGELINQVTGVKIKHIPFEGGAKAMTAVLGGHIDMAVSTISTSISNLRAGTLTGLAITTASRVEDVPDVPTMKELGYPDATFASYDGFMTSSKVPKDRLAIILDAFEKSLKDMEIQSAIKKAGMVPGFLSGPEYDAFLASQLDLLKRVANKAGIKE
jgi:tripartite-type tricarboxylate transporter receptor subunit TctC